MCIRDRYKGVSGNNLTTITRGIDSSLKSNHSATTAVFKYEFNGISLRKINKKHDIDIEVRACPHLPERNCNCRKPKTWMLRDERSLDDILIGDQESDMLAAKKANIKN